MASHIYHGPWINWSHGNIITGATLTLSDKQGGLLTSFIATFVALTGAQLWKIIAFAIHQARSTILPEDGLHHQQQAIWRNTPGPGGAAWVFAQQAWVWRNKARGSFLRTIPLALFGMLYLGLFGLTAVYSSYISKAPGPQRLIHSNNCGFWTVDTNSPDNQTAFAARIANESLVSSSYARACYGGAYNPLFCSRLPVPSIPWTQNFNATCPFRSGMCLEGTTSALEMTSKLMDSQLDLGLNTPRQYRLQFQKRTSCAPLNQTGYVSTYNYTRKDGHNDTYIRTWYGPYPMDKPADAINFTDQTGTHGVMDNVGYQLSAHWAPANDTGSTSWNPIPALFRDNADVMVLFLKMNSIFFYSPVDDPWFSSHWIFDETETPLRYGSDEWSTSLGCVEQYRVCNPNNHLCTDYLGPSQLLPYLQAQTAPSSRIGLNSLQMDMMTILEDAMSYASVYITTFTRGANALRATENLVQQRSANLPNNQWQIEVSSWFDGGLAAIQQKVLEYATGPNLILPGAKLWQPQNAAGEDGLRFKYLCLNQMINDSSETMSFSILGMSVLFIAGTLIILMSLFVDRIVGWLQVRFRFNLHGRHAWRLDDKLQLQKDLSEKSGMGRWKLSYDDIVPVTTGKDRWSRFGSEMVNSPNTPDTPDSGFMLQKYEYVPGYSPVRSGSYPGSYMSSTRYHDDYNKRSDYFIHAQ